MAYDTQELVSRFRSSGVSQKTFCERESVPVSTLQYHLQKVRRASMTDGPGFVPLSVDGAGLECSVVIVRGRLSGRDLADLVRQC